MSWTVPKVWNTGDIMMAPDLDTYVRDNGMWLYGDIAPMTLTLGNAWSSFGSPYGNPFVSRKGSACTIFGIASNSSGALQGVNSVIALLPGVEFLPPWSQRLGTNINGGNAGRCDVTAAGTVIIAGGSCPIAGYAMFFGQYSLI